MANEISSSKTKKLILFSSLALIAIVILIIVGLQVYESVFLKPTIVVSQLKNTVEVVNTDSFQIDGVISPADATLFIDKEIYPTKDGKFSFNKKLDVGSNRINFDVEFKGKKTHVDFAVKRELLDEQKPDFTIAGGSSRTVEVPEIEIKGTVVSDFTKLTVDDQPVGVKDKIFSFTKSLQPGINTITVRSENSKSGLTGYQPLSITRELSAEEKQAFIDEATKVNPSPEFKVFEKTIGNKVIFDYDEFGYWHYYEPKKDEKIIYIKATATRDFDLWAWSFNDDGTIKFIALSQKFQNRKYSDQLSDVPGTDNNFEYRDNVKLVFFGFIPKEFANRTWFFTEGFPYSIDKLADYKVLAKIN